MLSPRLRQSRRQQQSTQFLLSAPSVIPTPSLPLLNVVPPQLPPSFNLNFSLFDRHDHLHGHCQYGYCNIYCFEDGVWRNTTSEETVPQIPASLPKYEASQKPPASSGKQWSDLPEEIKESVLAWVGRKDLRSCRLVNRHTGFVATRILFRTVCISPSKNSVDRLYLLSLKPALADLVRRIEVHTHYLIDAPFDDFISFGPLARRLQRLQPLEAATLAIRLSRAYTSELESQAIFSAEGPSILSPVLKRFIRLRHFVHVRQLARTATGSYILDDDADLVQRTGVSLLDDRRQYPLMNSVLQKCCHLRPDSIDLSALYWWEFYNISQIPHLKDLFCRVRRLTLTFQVESFDRPQCRLNAKSRNWVGGLTRYLVRLPSLLPEVEDLRLGFDSLPQLEKTDDHVRAYALTRISGLLLLSTNTEPPYPKLKILLLDNIGTTVKELCGFLLPHASTLKSLAITNMYIDGQQAQGTNGGVLGSMVKMTSFLQHHLKLENMCLQGTFVDHKGVAIVCDYKGSKSILHQMQEYVCHRQHLPLMAHRVKKQALKEGKSDAPLSVNLFTIKERGTNTKVDLKMETDDSWYFKGLTSMKGR